MSVSNAFGSNTFNIYVALAVPWAVGCYKNGGAYHDVGSAALMLAYVAAGRYIGVYEYQINSWDCLAGIAMVRETGGWTNDFLANDGLLTGNPVLVAAPGVKDAMQKLFAAAGH